ncbi:hypothetical protein R3P38DRAFT_3182446 [Favolaschia claudopus]|uniref:Uncharacterized protein n=1 Tax=Favolaschia claudopus TaxID=2862362 RepID=A0AAW0CII1_9AGAR
MQFFGTNDVLDYMMAYLPLVPLMTFGQVNQDLRYEVQAYSRRRVLRYTQPFFETTLARTTFFHVLEDQGAWIVGAVALAVLSFACNPVGPGAMNIITPFGSESEWVSIMSRALGFNMVIYTRTAGDLMTLGHRYFVFTHPKIKSKIITVTTTRRGRFFELFLRAPVTLMGNAITAHEMVSTYVDLTTNYEGVYGFTYAFTRPIMPIGFVGPMGTTTARPKRLPVSPFPSDITLAASTRTLNRPCGTACPAIPRISTNLAGIGHWKWGGVNMLEWEEDENLKRFAKTDIQYRTGVICRNIHCPEFCDYE